MSRLEFPSGVSDSQGGGRGLGARLFGLTASSLWSRFVVIDIVQARLPLERSLDLNLSAC